MVESPRKGSLCVDEAQGFFEDEGGTRLGPKWRMRAGKGKLRNRRHVQKLRPLVVCDQDQGIIKALRVEPWDTTENVKVKIQNKD